MTLITGVGSVVVVVVVVFGEDYRTVGICFTAGLSSNVTPFKKKDIWFAFASVDGG